jgi:hypothetical protein
MGILDYFKPVDSWPPDKVRQFLNEKSPQDYNLVDVSLQPGGRNPCLEWSSSGRSSGGRDGLF